MVSAAVGLMALSGAGISTAVVAAPTPSIAPSGLDELPGRQLLAGAQRRLQHTQAQCVITSTGTPVGGIKHVWLIILENKSYDETFTGLNQNSYLWQTLPQQGALLTNYYGTGHFSMDNYISLVSGQSPVLRACRTTARPRRT